MHDRVWVDYNCDAFLALVQLSLSHPSYFDVKEQQLSLLLHRSAVFDEDVLTYFERLNPSCSFSTEIVSEEV